MPSAAAQVLTLLALAALAPGATAPPRDAPPGGPPASTGCPAAAAHDLHVSYADMAMEGSVIAGRIRLFKDDLERALGQRLHADAFTLRPGAAADALVLGYLRQNLTLQVDGTVLEPVILQSGEDLLDRGPVWWVLVQYEAPAPIEELRVRNTLLFDVFDDQRNIMKLVRFPEETPRTFYFAEGEEEHAIRF